MLVFVPATLSDLRVLAGGGTLPGPDAYAVTPGLRAAFAGQDDEMLEYAAMDAAAEHSLLLLAERDDTARRVVLVADVDPSRFGAERSPGAGELTGPLTAVELLSIYLDDDAVGPVVQRVKVAVGQSGSVPEGADAETLADTDLQWYDVEELPRLV